MSTESLSGEYIEEKRPYSQIINLSPSGEGLLVNRNLILLCIRHSVWGKTELNIVAPRSIPIRRNEEASELKTVTHKNPLTDAEGIGRLALRVYKGIQIYIGKDYRVICLGLNHLNTFFRLNSREPLRFEMIKSGSDFKAHLQSVLMKNVS